MVMSIFIKGNDELLTNRIGTCDFGDEDPGLDIEMANIEENSVIAEETGAAEGAVATVPEAEAAAAAAGGAEAVADVAVGLTAAEVATNVLEAAVIIALLPFGL